MTPTLNGLTDHDQYEPGQDRLRWVDLVNVIATDVGRGLVDDETAGEILWEHTCYPFGPPSMVTAQLIEYFADGH